MGTSILCDRPCVRMCGLRLASEYFDAAYGELLPGSSEQVGVWWASSGWKIGRERGLPQTKGEAIVIRAAKNEAEAAQLVIRPKAAVKGLDRQAGGSDRARRSDHSRDVRRGPGGAIRQRDAADGQERRGGLLARSPAAAGETSRSGGREESAVLDSRPRASRRAGRRLRGPAQRDGGRIQHRRAAASGGL